MPVKHPHFDYEPTTDCYVSKAMPGTRFKLRQSGDEWIALVAMRDGTLPPVQQEPFAWADDEWDCLDAVHAQR